MQTEIEAKFINVDPDTIRTQLNSLGAILVHPERLMRRRTFDFADTRLNQTGSWARVRDEGDKITMSFKQNKDDTLHGTVEINLSVDDFDTAADFLKALGLVQKSYQETKREAWLVGGAEITIDTWPWIAPFVEIEGHSEQAVRAAATKLGFDWAEAMHGSVTPVYQLDYDVTAAEVNGWETITFEPVPAWLEQRRKPRHG